MDTVHLGDPGFLPTFQSEDSCIHSLLFYTLEFGLGFGVCCFKKQFETITPIVYNCRPYVHSLVIFGDPDLALEESLDPASVTPESTSFKWPSISCDFRFSNKCLLCQLHARPLNLDFSTINSTEYFPSGTFQGTPWPVVVPQLLPYPLSQLPLKSDEASVGVSQGGSSEYKVWHK